MTDSLKDPGEQQAAVSSKHAPPIGNHSNLSLVKLAISTR